MDKQECKLISDDLVVLAGGYSTQTSASNRYWIACALLTLLIVSHDPSRETIPLFGLQMSSRNSMDLILVLLSISNIVYCSAHIQGYKAAEVFRKFLDQNKALPIRDEIAHLLATPQINRLAPFNHVLLEEYRWSKTYEWLKTAFDLILASVPTFGVFYGVTLINPPSSDIGFFNGLTLVGLIISIPASLVATLFLCVTVIRRDF